MKNCSPEESSQPFDRLYQFPFDVVPCLAGQSAGGMEAVLLREMELRREALKQTGALQDNLVLFSCDPTSFDLPEYQARVHGYEGPQIVTANESMQYGLNDQWLALHHDAFHNGGQTAEAVAAMYLGQYASSPTSIERVVEHFDRHNVTKTSPNFFDKLAAVNRDYMEKAKPGSVVHWNVPRGPIISKQFAGVLKPKGIYQTAHWHFPLPEHLSRFALGRMMLEGLDQVDAAYFHTDDDIANFERQKEELGLRGNPKTSRFDLGIDTESMRKGVAQINSENYRESIPSYSALDDERKEFIDEIFRSQEKVPHRFICADRLDPIKGVNVVLDAMENFLDNSGLSLEEMRAKFRFFFAHDFRDLEKVYPDHFATFQFMHYVQSRYEKLAKKYPGVIYVSGSIPKLALAAALKGTHYLTGSVHEGLNLACQEALFVNAETDQDNTAVIGGGAGFAKHMVATGNDHLAYFPKAGDVAAFTAAIRDIVQKAEHEPGAHRRRTRQMAEEVISRRNDSVIVDRI